MLRQKQSQKAKLNQTLRSWLPILQASSDELKEVLEGFVIENPFAKIEQKPPKRVHFENFHKNAISSELEALTTYKKSLYETLFEQICPPLFPTQKSQNLAIQIINCINCEGYFEFDDEILKDFTKVEVESVRARFAYLEPCGVGAKDYKESFLFQIYELTDDDELIKICKILIENFENLQKFTKFKRYNEAINLIKKLKNPPAIEFLEDNNQITPDIFVYESENGIEMSVNDDHYPEILIDTDGLDSSNEFISSRVKQAKDLIDALQMRKATLYKIGLMIVEYQYDYFFGGDIKPMKLKDVADDLGRNPSTISRAIANKFLSSKRGVMPLKNFFAAVASNDVSNSAIKDFISNLVKNENRKKPLSDEAILEKIESEFDIKLVRRTITKYRKALNIGSSSQRKKIYDLQGNLSQIS